MAKKDIDNIIQKAKGVTVSTARVIADTTVDIAEKTQKAVVDTTQKIKDDIQEKKDAAIKARQDEVEAAMEELRGTFAERLLEALGESPVELTKGHMAKIKDDFPIPTEQCILWADAEFDLRPSGVVCTNKGVFVKTNTGVFTKKPKKKKKGEEPSQLEQPTQAVLFYYKWEGFEPDWFVSDDATENRVMLVEPQCRDKFITACKALAPGQLDEDAFLAEFDFEDSQMEALLAQVVPLEVAALQSAQSAVFVEQKAHINTTAGHGEMAEEAITLLDKLTGKNATVVGRDNAKDGADRLVDGIFIQTKYYKTARGSLDACFRPEDGLYRYMDNGKPMQLEVPKDQYDKVLAGFKKKIEQDKVRGVTDPAQAEKIVRKGRLTYDQAVNLTKPGTVESLTYDILTGAVLCSCAFGITFVVTVFLTWRKTGDLKQAIKAGASAGIQVFGISFIQHMVVSQIARTGLANALIGPSQYVVGKLGYQASATIVNGIRALSGKGAIYGAAASKHLAKILRSNVIPSALTFAVFSIPETYNLAVKKISSAQYAKNMTVLVGSIAGGAGGAVAAGVVAAKVAGAAGTAVAPGVVTAVGIAGGFVGGVVGAKAVDIVGDILREDDIQILSRLFNAMVSCLIGEYLLDASEMDKLMERLDKVSQKEFKPLFGKILKSETQETTIREFLTPHFEEIIVERQPFALPGSEVIVEALIDDCE